MKKPLNGLAPTSAVYVISAWSLGLVNARPPHSNLDRDRALSYVIEFASFYSLTTTVDLCHDLC
jgi:hypothetical protein